MPLALVLCNCHNAAPIAYGVLQEAGVKDYLSVPVYKGQQKSREFLDSFSPEHKELEDWKEASRIVNCRSSYSIIVGYNENGIVCAEVGHGQASDRADGLVIAQKFQ